MTAGSRYSIVRDKHHEPAGQIVVVLSGELEVGTSDGEKRRATAGQAFIADDLTGKGHVTKVIRGPAHVMFVQLPANFDFARWSAWGRAIESSSKRHDSFALLLYLQRVPGAEGSGVGRFRTSGLMSTCFGCRSIVVCDPAGRHPIGIF
jgi:hypothetical protein